jgi:hypothetical protein
VLNLNAAADTSGQRSRPIASINPSVTAHNNGHGLQMGFDALRRHRDEQRARQESATKRSAKRHRDPGRPISRTLLSHHIPEHVNEAIASPTEWEGGGQDQRLLFKRLQCDVVYPLVLRGFSAQEFLDFMPTYTPPATREGSRRNVLWEELTTRGRRERHPHQYEPIVVKAFKYAEEAIESGFVPDQDQPEYIAALSDWWHGVLTAGRISLLPAEIGVIKYVLAQMRIRGFLNVTCPCREVGKAIGVRHVAAWRTLQDLAEDGILICRSRGVAGRREAAIYCLTPHLPEERMATKPEKSSSYGTGITLKQENQQVNSALGGQTRVKHTNSLRVSSSPNVGLPSSSGSIGMFRKPGEEFYTVSIDDLIPPKQVQEKGPDAVEDYYAQLWGAWAVLWPGRWPKAHHLPRRQVVVFPSRSIARWWVSGALRVLGDGQRRASTEAYSGLTLWLEIQLKRHEWHAAWQRLRSPDH